MGTRLGNYLNQIRTEKGLSLRKACSLINLSHSYLDKLEKGCDPTTGNPNIPTSETLRLIAKGYDISYAYLLSLTDYIISEDDLTAMEYREIIELAKEKGIPPKILKDIINNYK